MDSDDSDDEEVDLEKVMQEATKRAKTGSQSTEVKQPAGILKKSSQPSLAAAAKPQAAAQSQPQGDGSPGKKKRNRKRAKKNKK